MATVFTRWISRRKARRAKKRLTETGTTLKGDAPQSFSDFTPTSPTSAGATVSGGGGGGSGGGGTSYAEYSARSGLTTQQAIERVEQQRLGTDITSLGATSGLSSMQKFEASKMVVQASGGVKVGGSTYIGKAIVPFSGGKTANQIRAEEQRKATQLGYGGYGRWSSAIPIEKEKTTETTGLDLIPKRDIKDIKGDGKYKPFKKDSIPSFDPTKKIIFIKPSEMKGFTSEKGYSDFEVTDFTKTTEGKAEGEQLESLSDFTDSLESGSYAISLKGDMEKVKEIGVSKDTRVQYAPDGSVVYSGGVSPVMKGMTQDEIKTWKSKLKESAKFKGLDFSMKPYVDVYKEKGIYEGTKYAITHPLIIKDIPIAKAVLPVVYKTFLESPAKGLAKISEYQARPIMTAGGEEFKVEQTKKQKQREEKFKEFVGYDPNIPLLADPDVQMFAITGATLGLAGAGSVGAKVLKPVGRVFQAHITSQAIKNPTEENLAMALIFTAPEVLANRGKIIQEFSGKRPSQYVPNKNEISYVASTSRQRATLMIKNEKGEYLVSKKKGISSGGKIDAGETPRQAMIREVKEELGLSEKDFYDIKFKEKIVTPEETFYTFEAVLKPNTKINSMSDMVGGIKWIGKSKYKGVTGQTYRNPVMKDGVRVYELAIMNRLSGTKKPVTG